jgi:hypothetical protein
MIELAVFGSLLMAALAVLLRYALTGQYTQQTKMRAFRNALMIASRPAPDDGHYPIGGASSLIIDQRLVVDPTNAFGLGGFTPVFDSASVLRDPRMDTAEDGDVQMRIELNEHVLPEFPVAEFDDDMGFEDNADSTRQTTSETVLLKTEDDAQITTVTGVAWTEKETSRAFTYPGGSIGGTLENPLTIRDEHSTTMWVTPWETP